MEQQLDRPVNNVRALEKKGSWLMDDQGTRVETLAREIKQTIDQLSAFMHKELGAAPHRDAAAKSISRRVATLEKRVNQHIGAIRLAKWLIGILGAGNVAAMAKLLGAW